MKYIVKLKIDNNLNCEETFYKSFGLDIKYKKKGGFLYTSIPLFWYTEAYNPHKRIFMEKVEKAINDICNMTDEEFVNMIKDKIIHNEGIIQMNLDRKNKEKDLVNKFYKKINKLKKLEIEISEEDINEERSNFYRGI